MPEEDNKTPLITNMRCKVCWEKGISRWLRDFGTKLKCTKCGRELGIPSAGPSVRFRGSIDSMRFRTQGRGIGISNIKGATPWSDGRGSWDGVIEFETPKQKDSAGDGVQEPISDIYDEENEVLVTIELPGVDDEGISVAIENGCLIIKATRVNRKYEKSIPLPDSVGQGFTRFLKNGILKVSFEKIKSPTTKEKKGK
ncbi:Hsp20/alpha crystallin family protein [Patescibacteria group bacterium AH-259-L07]|nr:Hsp20/alpha crystallin family protein [Patescibacteria group bacterium AH-259-L07]